MRKKHRIYDDTRGSTESRKKDAGRSLRIAMEDNGQGMTPTQGADLKSLGIVGMKERISRIGGAFQIFSEPGKGTRLDILIPTHHD